MLLAKVSSKRAETVRKALFRRRLGAKDRRIVRRPDHVLIPLRERPPDGLAAELGFELVEGETSEKTCYRPPYELIVERADLPGALGSSLPRRWEMLGDVLLLRLPDDLVDHRTNVAGAYAEVLGARTVLWDRGEIEGVHRTPRTEVLWGQGTETVHLENGIRYKLDAARLMYSSGNIDEKLRLAALDCRGETVVDMFAGIGYFSLPLGMYTGAERVIACEINPLAYRYLVDNVELNDLQGVVEPVLGDNRDLPGYGIADRVVMGYVRTTGQFLEKAFALTRRGGTIHYHDTFPLAVFPQQAEKNLERAAGGRRYEIKFVREVKSYSPGVSHMVLDVMVL